MKILNWFKRYRNKREIKKLLGDRNKINEFLDDLKSRDNMEEDEPVKNLMINFLFSSLKEIEDKMRVLDQKY